MDTLRHILVPVDFSTCSTSALEHAAAWATKLGASLDLIHVWEMPALSPQVALGDTAIGSARFAEFVRRDAETALEHFAQAARARGIPVRSTIAVLGSPALQIAQAARAGRYDLIVMGTHGRTGLHHFLVGSVTERVVRLAACPVLTVPGAARNAVPLA